MARNSQIEAILAAWLEWEETDPPHKNEARLKFHSLLDDARKNTQFSRAQLTDCLYGQFKGFKVQMRKAAQVQVAQSKKA